MENTCVNAPAPGSLHARPEHSCPRLRLSRLMLCLIFQEISRAGNSRAPNRARERLTMFVCDQAPLLPTSRRKRVQIASNLKQAHIAGRKGTNIQLPGIWQRKCPHIGVMNDCLHIVQITIKSLPVTKRLGLFTYWGTWDFGHLVGHQK